MAALTIILVPLLIMFFALGMERVEARLRQVAVGEDDVEEFLEQARPNEVLELFKNGFGRALELFRRRQLTPPGQAATPRPSSRLASHRPLPTHGASDQSLPAQPSSAPTRYVPRHAAPAQPGPAHAGPVQPQPARSPMAQTSPKWTPPAGPPPEAITATNEVTMPMARLTDDDGIPTSRQRAS